jgi:hypothetical protein
MTNVLIVTLTVLAALGSGLVAGIFFAFSAFLMTALSRLPPLQGIAAMQSINVAVYDQNGVVDNRPRQDDEPENRQHVQVLHRHVAVADTPVMHQRQTKEPAERGQRHADHDHERVHPALKQDHHQQVNHQERQEERTGDQPKGGAVTEKSGLDFA